MSNKQFCAINDNRYLSCYKINPESFSLSKIENLNQNDQIQNVSTGSHQICTINRLAQVFCFAQTNSYFLPQKLKTKGALQLSLGAFNYCGISTKRDLFCWGVNFKLDLTNDHNYTKQFSGPVWQVSVGRNSLCYIVGLRNLKCYSMLLHR